jgi:phenylpropionate dioxygenase-like ring-hydroxylating dioxygenase large terminal subunit
VTTALFDRLAAVCGISDHRLATSLPPDAYCSPELFELERTNVLEAGWQPLCRTEQVAAKGSYYSVDLLGTPLVVTRDTQGEVRVLSRSCRHRTMDVVAGAGRARKLECQYHRWTYGLDGRLLSAPLMKKVPGFDPGQICLPQVRHEEWNGFLFVNLDGKAAPLAASLVDLNRQLENYELGGYHLVDVSDWDCPWDWKIMVENFMECYHHLGIHANSVEPTFPARDTWTGRGGDAFSVVHVPRQRRGDDPVPELPGSPLLSTDQGEELLLFAIYPHFVATIGPGYLYWLRLLPTGPGKLQVQLQICLSAAARSHAKSKYFERELVDDIIAIHREDLPICAAVQRAAHSRLAAPGRLSSLERPLWEFYRFLGRKLGICDCD